MIDEAYHDLEQKYTDLDWILVDSGSTIHVCRDKRKLYNLRRHSTAWKAKKQYPDSCIVYNIIDHLSVGKCSRNAHILFLVFFFYSLAL